MGKYFTKTIKPSITTSAATAYADTDLLFDWYAFEIPKGAARIISTSITCAGTNGFDANAQDLDLIFAKSIDGVAPTTLGTPNQKLSDGTLTAAICAKVKNNIIGYSSIDKSAISNDGDLVAYNVWQGPTTNVLDSIVLEGDMAYGSTEGFQTIWMAAIAKGAFDFGTDIQLNQVGHQAAATAATQITIEQGGGGAGVAAKSFQVGDILRGQTGGPTMELVSLDSATAITVKNISEQIDNDEELLLDAPIIFRFGFEY
tara:strand:- start:1177 stop:1950 length:774 start_codon:yes stop_codon:yes gene_type:complete